MQPRLPESILAELSNLLSSRIGMYFPSNRWRDLERGIMAAARELGFKNTRDFISGLLTSSLARPQLEVLASHLTVGETYFFREPKSFDAVEQNVLKKLIDGRRRKEQRIRIWSAGCASGEEPYSLAILLHRLLPDIRDWNVSILATDINPRLLQKAEQGAYSEWSFRGVSKQIKDTYFKLTLHGRYQIRPDIKQLVSFSYLNLVDDGYPALTNGTNAMDMIFCRNVMMYFQSTQAGRIIDKFHRCLVDGGWLVVSSVEASHTLFQSFVHTKYQDVVLYRKADPEQRQQPVMHDWSVDIEPVVSVADVSSSYLDTTTQPSLKMDDIKTDSIDAEVSDYEKALELFHFGCYIEAETKTTAHLSVTPDDGRALMLMTRILANQGRLTEASAWCKRAIVNDKLNPGMHYLLGTILLECNQLNDAVISLRRALYLDPNLVLAHFTLGNISRAQGKTAEACKHFDNARMLLRKHEPEYILPESEGMTRHRLLEIIETIDFGKEAA